MRALLEWLLCWSTARERAAEFANDCAAASFVQSMDADQHPGERRYVLEPCDASMRRALKRHHPRLYDQCQFDEHKGQNLVLYLAEKGNAPCTAPIQA
jgi:hypothetical protein